MKRRQFMFRSLKAATIFHPVLNIRQAEAQQVQKMRALFFVEGSSYSFPQDFFPNAGVNGQFQLSPILSDFKNLKNDMVIVDGINIVDSGPSPAGTRNNHVRSMGKVLTAKNLIEIKVKDGLPGGPSMDQIVAKQLGVRSSAVQVATQRQNALMRSAPFATGVRQFRLPIINPADVWDDLFGGFKVPPKNSNSKNVTSNNSQELRYLNSAKSIMDDLTDELKRFRKELVGVEKIKLDATESAIRTAERSVASEIEALGKGGGTVQSANCSLPKKVSIRNHIPFASETHFNIMYAALLCNRVGVGSFLFGSSAILWRYWWLKNVNLKDQFHFAIAHKRGAGTRSQHVECSRWIWGELAKFAERLKATPDGSSNMLNNTLIYATSCFGRHHELQRTPLVLLGNAQGRLKTGRSVKVNNQSNAKSLTLAAHLCGLKNIKGVGDEPNCGPLNI